MKVDGEFPVSLLLDPSNCIVPRSGASAAASYTSDGHLKRVKSVEGGQVTYSVYSALGGSILFRDEVGAGRVTDYISAGGAGVRLVNGAAEYTHSDLLGSPRAATSASGALLWRESYTPFGEARLRPPANAGNVGFTGHVEDAATGLTYMQARYYDPVIARFLSTDPIGYQDQLNLYAYVANDPVNATDPTGMWGIKGGLEVQVSLFGLGGGGTLQLAISYDTDRPVTGTGLLGQAAGHLNRLDAGLGGGIRFNAGIVSALSDPEARNFSTLLSVVADTGVGAIAEGGAFWGADGTSATVEDLEGTSLSIGAGRHGTGAFNDAVGSLRDAFRGDTGAIIRAFGKGIRASPIPGSLQYNTSDATNGIDVGFGPTVGLTADANISAMLSTEDLRTRETE